MLSALRGLEVADSRVYAVPEADDLVEAGIVSAVAEAWELLPAAASAE